MATAIKLQPYTVMSGPNQGKVIPYTRGLILAGEDQYKTLLTYRKAWEGLRGRVFNVSRSDGPFSPKIGDTWDPKAQLTDEEMMEKFADVAADYGLSVEDYCRPMDYETILKQDLAWVKKCDALLRLPGDSPGADREVQYALSQGLLVTQSMDYLDEANVEGT